jgi:alkanesulfonate monooxygenase SsuD/methylene tetrahydromethanopterin reductase-like flavin-dependent oxidoreductase (luciferase family)
MAAAFAAVTTRLPIMIGAAILPLYDPVRLAEEMVVLDHLSRGRVIYTLAVGYRPAEYELYGENFAGRGAIADAKLATLLDLLGRASGDAPGPRVTPAPFTAGGPMLTWGGGSKVAARRAARNGLGFIGQTSDPSVGEAYTEAATAAGRDPVFCMLPDHDMPASVFVHDDLDAGWAEVGPSLLADAVPYHRWNTDSGQAAKTVSLSSSTTVEGLREENGSHRVVTVDGAVELIGKYGTLGLQPLCGGLDPDVAWTYLRRVVDEVLPAAAART